MKTETKVNAYQIDEERGSVMKTLFNGMQIDKRSDDCFYITIGDWVIYLDNSTGEHIIDTWIDKKKHS